MAANKIFEIGKALSLSSQHLNLYFKNRAIDAECVALADRELSDLSRWLPFVADEALALRLSAESSEEAVRQFPRLPTNVSWLATADILLPENGSWWPRLFMYQTLQKLLVARFPEVDTSLCGYVVGATHKGRAAVAALAAMGFSQIRIIDHRPDLMKREADLLKRYLFGLDISTVRVETLTMETIPGSLMLNTLPLQDHGTVIKDLSYFNFMKTGSVVIDTASCDLRNPFLDEAESASLKTLSGVEYQSQWDVELLQKLFPQTSITYEDYLESFSDALEGLKNPPSV